MRPLRTPEWLKKPLERLSSDKDTDGPTAEDAPPQPQQIPTFEELAEVLPNLKRNLR